MEYMKRARKRRKLTQQQLAKRLNVSVSCVSLYESGKRLPNVDMAKLIGKTPCFKWTRFYDDGNVDM